MYTSYLKTLKGLQRDFKRKRIILDEYSSCFGFDDMRQLVKVNNSSDVKGYPFVIEKKGLRIALKVVPVETKYEKFEHPSLLEFILLKYLSEDVVDKLESPHITYYLGEKKVSNKCKSLKNLNLKKLEVSEKIRQHSNILISEFVSGGSLDNWIYTRYEAKKDISDACWKGIVFQLLYTIHILHDKYRLMHNDFHYGNILMSDEIEPGGYFVYNLNGKKFYLKNYGCIPKLWDFEFAMVFSDAIPVSYPNRFVLGHLKYDQKTHMAIESLDVDTDNSSDVEVSSVPIKFTKAYDVHYLLTSLLDLYVSQELFDWIVSLYPSELIPEESTSSGCTHQSNDTISQSESVNFRSENNTDRLKYLDQGRMINGVETQFNNLPFAENLLQSEFFVELTKEPADFDPTHALYFSYTNKVSH